MALLKTDGTKMTMEEIADLLTFAALLGDKPEEVSSSAWLAACEYVYHEAERELSVACDRRETAESQVNDAIKSREAKKRQYEEAKAANNKLCDR